MSDQIRKDRNIVANEFRRGPPPLSATPFSTSLNVFPIICSVSDLYDSFSIRDAVQFRA